MNGTVENHIIKLEGYEIQYVLRRKNIKNINLRIKSDATVSVSAPLSTKFSVIEGFMISKSMYIIQHVEKFKQRQMTLARSRGYVDGEVFYIMGKGIQLKILQGEKEAVSSDGAFLYVQIKDPLDEMRKERLVKKFFDQECDKYFKEIVTEIYPIFAKYGIEYPIIKKRNMTSRWGSCMPRKNQITLNTKLIGAPRECIEYVVLHEFAHFIHPNHSKNFYNFISTFIPDWRERKKRLEATVLV